MLGSATLKSPNSSSKSLDIHSINSSDVHDSKGSKLSMLYDGNVGKVAISESSESPCDKGLSSLSDYLSIECWTWLKWFCDCIIMYESMCKNAERTRLTVISLGISYHLIIENKSNALALFSTILDRNIRRSWVLWNLNHEPTSAIVISSNIELRTKEDNTAKL